MKEKYTFIDTHGSPLLQSAILAIFKNIDPDISWNFSEEYPVLCFIRPERGSFFHRKSREDLTGINVRDVLHIDAATEMGKLVELLEVKPVIIKNVGDYDAVVSPDKKTVKVGCREITAEKVKEVYQAMFGEK